MAKKRNKKLQVNRTERGWAGHFICAYDCSFRRNTMLECGDIRIIVSTVGNMRRHSNDDAEEIGLHRFYETMAFHAEFESPYWEADVSMQVYFDAEWAIDHCTREADLEADNMHENVVKEITKRLAIGESIQRQYP